jgi:hypothetical protein
MLYNVSDLPTNDSVVEHKLDIKISVQALFLLKLRYLPTLHFLTKIIKMKIKNTKLSENNRPIEKKSVLGLLKKNINHFR